jgi:two-component system LytT family response regulator
MTIRTILVDDEPLAIQGLRLRLAPHEDVEIIETCTNGREAIRAIKTHKPDLVFLDIQMPGFDGFSVVQGLMEVEPPLFVFVTAYEDHALRAFEAGAVDYLMKPVDEHRLADTLDRVRQRLAEKRGPRRSGSSRKCSPRSRPMRRQLCRQRRRARVEPLREADQHQGSRPDLPRRRRHDRADRRRRRLYVHLHRRQYADPARDDEGPRKAPRSAPLPARPSLDDRQPRPGPQVKPHTNGECFLVLDSGAQVKVSRSYREVVARFVH